MVDAVFFCFLNKLELKDILMPSKKRKNLVWGDLCCVSLVTTTCLCLFFSVVTLLLPIASYL